MKHSVCLRLLVIICALAAALRFLPRGVNAVVSLEPTEPTVQEPADPEPTEAAADEELLGAVEELPDRIANGILGLLQENMDALASEFMDGWMEWAYNSLLTVSENLFASITLSSTSIFDYAWFNVIVGLFRNFGLLLFGVGVVMAFVDVGIEYRRRGADLTGMLLNLGKGLFAVSLFYIVPAPLFVFCVGIQHDLLRTFAGDWSFQTFSDAFTAQAGAVFFSIIMLVIVLVLIFKLAFDSLKRGGLLLVQICIGSLHMLSVPRGYLDNFYGWCKQVIALCVTVMLQNILLFCGLMLIPTNILLGIGVMCAAKDVPRICAQFGLDTSVKVNLTQAAMGANAAMQAVKAGVALLA